MANDLNIVYKIAADITGLQQGVNRAATATEKLTATASKVGAAFAGAFTVGAVVAFGKELIADADALVKLSDKTGLSLQALQKFQIAGDDAGNSIDQLTNAVTKMQDKLASGDKSAVAALTELGLNFEDIKKLSPEDQFIAIADAIQQIQDPAEQVRLAIDLFGKSGAEILPTLKRDFDDLRDATVGMSDQTIRALDRVGDGMTRFGRELKATVANAIVDFVDLARAAAAGGEGSIIEAVARERAEALRTEQLKKRIEVMAAAARKQLELNDAVTGFVGPVMDAATESRNYALMLDKQEAAQRKAAEATDRAADIQRAFTQSVTDATIGMRLSTFTLHRWGLIELPNVTSSLEGVDREIHTLASTTLPDFGLKLDDVGLKGRVSLKGIASASTEAKDTLGEMTQAFAQLGQIAPGALGGVAKSIGTITGAMNLAKKAGDSVADTFDKAGNKIEATAGQVAMAATSIFGAALVIADVWNQAFPGEGPFVERMRAFRSAMEFADANGGLEKLKLRADAAGVSLDQLHDLFNAKDADALAKSIDEITAAFDLQDGALQKVADTAAKWNINTALMGPVWEKQELGKKAAELFQDWTVLHTAGVDQVEITQKMSKEVSDFVNRSIKMGTTIPEAMRPMLQNFVDMGDLFDENGEKITDLSKINFSKDMSEQFKDVLDGIQKLIDAIERGLNPAIRNIPDGSFTVTAIQRTVTENTVATVGATAMATVAPLSAFEQAMSTARSRVPTLLMADGGFGHADGPMAFFTKGNEDFAFSGEGQSFSGADERPIVVHTYLDGRLVAENFIQRAAHDTRGVGTKLRDVVTR